MKSLAIALGLLFLSTPAFAAAPLGISGQSDTSNQYPPVVKVPNKLATKITGGVLLENGNNNLLSNPSFEHSTYNTGWTTSGCTASEETTIVAHGKKSLKMACSSQTLSVYQDTTLYASQLVGANSVRGVNVWSDVAGVKVCSGGSATASTTCIDVRSNSAWGDPYLVPTPMNGTSNGVYIKSDSAITGNIYIDNGNVEPTVFASVDSSKLAGSAYTAPTASCSWTRTNTAYGAPASVAACPDNYTINSSTMGTWSTTTSDLPQITVNSLPQGRYVMVAMAGLSNASAGAYVCAAVNDGTTTGAGSCVSGAAGGVYEVSPTLDFYHAGGNKTFSLQLKGSSGAASLEPTANGSGIQWFLYYYGTTSAFTATNSDTDWASCGHTTSSFTGFGTVTSIETQCKRDRGDLLMKGNFTLGTPTATEARLALPTWNGTQLTSKGTSVIPSIQLGSMFIDNDNSSAPFRYTLIEPSVTYVTFGTRASSTSTALTKVNGNTIAVSGEKISLQVIRIPINGWENSNVIYGTFNEVNITPGVVKPITFSAKVSSAAAISDNRGGIFNSCSYSSGDTTCTFVSGKITGTPTCIPTIVGSSGSKTNVTSRSSSQVVIRTKTAADADSQIAFDVICHGEAL